MVKATNGKNTVELHLVPGDEVDYTTKEAIPAILISAPNQMTSDSESNWRFFYGPY